MNVLDRIKKVAQVLDESGRKDAPIRARSRRDYLMSIGLKPEKRGGDLFVGKHPIICGHGKDL